MSIAKRKRRKVSRRYSKVWDRHRRLGLPKPKRKNPDSKIPIAVRSGLGTVQYVTPDRPGHGSFSDVVEWIYRTPSYIGRKMYVSYKGKKRAVLGGIRTDYFLAGGK